MDNAYCMPGVVSKIFISTNAFRALKDPLKLVLLLSLHIAEETEAQGVVPESHRSWMWCWVSESLLPAPELCCLGRDSVPGVDRAASNHRNTSPLPDHLWSGTPSLYFWLSDSALFFSRSYFVSYIIYFILFWSYAWLHILKMIINHECLWHFKKMGPF